MMHTIERIHHLSSASKRRRNEVSAVCRFHTASSTLLLLLALLVVNRCRSQSDNEDVQDCYNNLFLSDANGDRRVDSEEYVTFVKLEGPSGFLEDVDTFIELPLPLQSNFFTLSCLCRSNTLDGSDACCLGDNAHLNITGTGPDEIPTDDQVDYLNLVCGFTAGAIDMVLEEERTPSPTGMPSTNETSMIPTQAPSVVQTTDSPSEFPTDNSTDTVSPSPSASLSPSPTTSSPDPTTTDPTSSPTVANVTAVPTTSSPTGAPSPFIPVPIVVKTVYNIVVPNGLVEDIPQSSYTPDLISAMDVVAPEVAAALPVPGEERRRGLRHGADLPTPRTAGILLAPADERNVISSSSLSSFMGDQNLLLRHEEATRNVISHGVRQLRTNVDHSEEQRQRQRRRLEILVTLPTEIEEIIDVGFTDDPFLVNGVFVIGPCPNDLGNATTDLCEQVTVAVTLELTEGEDAIAVYGAYLLALNEAIRNGDLEVALSNSAPNPVVAIATGQPATGGPPPSTAPPTPAPVGSDDGLSAGAIGGIAAGAAVVFLVVGYAAIKNAPDDPNKAKKRKRPTKTYSTMEGDGLDAETLQAVPASEKLELEKKEVYKVESFPEEEKQPEDEPPMEDDSMLLAAVPYISTGKTDEPPNQAREVDFANAHELGMHESTASPDARSTGGISHESDAGWSETYTSSMGTMSDDEMLPETPAQGALSQPNVVMLGASSALAGGPGDGGVAAADAKLEDLEKAIMDGNWVAVGATAAALASMQYDSQTKSDISKSTEGVSAVSSMMSHKWKEAIDGDKAAELDQLIESGDWEGIILAASKFEAEKSGMPVDSFIRTIGVTSSSDDLDHGLEVHEDNSDDDDEESSSLMPASSHTAASNVANLSRDEIRAQVLDLVKQVVPEEVDHVDEMMDQFLGREGDLLETLLAMKTRASAQQLSDGSSMQAVGLNSPEIASLPRGSSDSESN
jgi:hypothetical protein